MVSNLLLFESKRSEADIIHNILSETKDGIKKTQLMYNSNMSNTQLSRYLDILIEKDFIEQRTVDNNSKIYYITTKGLELLDPLDQIVSLFKK